MRTSIPRPGEARERTCFRSIHFDAEMQDNIDFTGVNTINKLRVYTYIII